MRSSLTRWTGQDLIGLQSDPVLAAKQIYFSPFALVSHNTDDDPVFNYANRTAQRLFRMNWSLFTSLQSRFSAEQGDRSERANLLAEVTARGFISDYHGVRISSKGERFAISDAIVWNLIDNQHYYGQAAMFKNWEFIDAQDT